MMTSSDMAYWMYVLSGIIPSRGEWNQKTRQIVEGNYIYSLEDVQRAYSFSPLQQLHKVLPKEFYIVLNDW